MKQCSGIYGLYIYILVYAIYKKPPTEHGMFLKTKKYQSDKIMGEKRPNKAQRTRGIMQRKSLDKDLQSSY